MNDRDPVNVSLLETFVHVAERGSVAAAAKALHRSQPAVSHRLRALEQDLGVPLFERVGRRIVPSRYGQTLLERARELVALSRSIRTAIDKTSTQPQGTVGVATLPTLAAHLLAPCVSAAMRSTPSVRWELSLGLGTDIVEQVRRGVCDLGLIAGGVSLRGLAAEQVGAIALAAALPPKVRWKRGALGPRELREHSYLAWTGLIDPTMDAVARFVARHRLVDEHTSRFPHIETLRELVAGGAGYTILPSYTLRRDEALHRIAVRAIRGLEERTPILVIHRSQAIRTPAFEMARTLLSRAASDCR